MRAGRQAALTALAVAAALPIALAGAGQAAAGGHYPGAARPAVQAGAWRTAREVPGMSALNRTGVARIESVSCASPGYCSAGGYYDASVHGTTFGQPFVVNEVNGTWRSAIEVPGVRALNTRKNGFVSSVSCTRPGDCSAGGRYLGPKGPPRAFVADEIHGTWRRAITLPVDGPAVEVSAVACASPRNCSAAGSRGDAGSVAGVEGTFVVSKVNGRWRKPVVIPGKLTFVYGAWVQSVSCPSAGNCAVAGWYGNDLDLSQAFVASQVHGTWHHYINVPGALALPGTDGTQVASLSCPKAGNCVVAGNFINGAGFLASEVNGTWHAAKPVPGLSALNRSGNPQLTALSCATAGNCSAGGWYHDSREQNHAFVVNEVNGTWHNAIEVPGMRRLRPSGTGVVTALSCPSRGNCSAGGFYYGAKSSLGFVVNEVNGRWHNAIEVPGMSALNRSGNAQITALSCARAGKCSAGGFYHATHVNLFAGQVFVADEGR